MFPSQAEFRNAVIALVKKGVPFTRAAQQLFDEIMDRSLKEANWPLACHEGCSGRCCRKFLPFCYEPEIDLIISFIKSKECEMPELLLRQARQQAIRWVEHCRQFKGLSKDAILLIWNELNDACAFLDLERDSCLVYPVRPMVCRAWISSQNSGGECQSCNFIFAGTAGRIIERRAAETGMKINISLAIINWLAIKRKNFF